MTPGDIEGDIGPKKGADPLKKQDLFSIRILLENKYPASRHLLGSIAVHVWKETAVADMERDTVSVRMLSKIKDMFGKYMVDSLPTLPGTETADLVRSLKMKSELIPLSAWELWSLLNSPAIHSKMGAATTQCTCQMSSAQARSEPTAQGRLLTAERSGPTSSI